jgi:rubrerythrin
MTDPADLPPVAVHSVGEVLAIAHAMECEAVARYAKLADCMRRVDQGETAELLEGLLAEERSHVDSVERLAQRILHWPTPRQPDSRASMNGSMRWSR